MIPAEYLTAAGWMRRHHRRDEAVVRWLERHPLSETHEIAAGLRHTRRATRQRLERLESEGRIRSTQIEDALFVYTGYTAAGP